MRELILCWLALLIVTLLWLLVDSLLSRQTRRKKTVKPYSVIVEAEQIASAAWNRKAVQE